MRKKEYHKADMIYIVTALYAEAHPFITRFQLKKDISHTRFQVFRNREAIGCQAEDPPPEIQQAGNCQAGICQTDLCRTGIRLVISGPGSIPAAVAASSICTEYGAGQGDFLLNVGVCAQIWNKKIPGTENSNSCQSGRIFLGSKIREQATGKTFYPDILYRHGFAEAPIITGAKIYEKSAPSEAEAGDFYLYDMEAAAVYQAGAFFFGPHQMSFLKIVSDDGNVEHMTPSEIEHLIGRNMEGIAEYIRTLQEISREEQPYDVFQEDAAEKWWERLCRDLHCSKSMSESLRQHIRYWILAGTNYVSVLEDMYRQGKLPCKDKREGKQCFEELKERLL